MKKINNKKITTHQARELRCRRRMNQEYWTIVRLASEYGLSKTAVRNILSFKTYAKGVEPELVRSARRVLLTELSAAMSASEYTRVTRRLTEMDIRK